MRVKAIKDHFDSTHTLRKEGEEFPYEGKLHEHIKRVADKPSDEADAKPAEVEAKVK